MTATNYAINKTLRKKFYKENYNLGANWYIGLSRAYISSNGGGALEPSDISYKRIKVPRDSASWNVDSTSGKVSNKISITFPTSQVDWGTIKEVFIIDADLESGKNEDGNVWFHSILEPEVPILAGTTITFPPNSIFAIRE